jgi:hypothetical protein
VKPKTEELLYFLLYACEVLTRPTFRNLTDSFESWAYRSGFHRRLIELEQQGFLEARGAISRGASNAERAVRLMEAGKLHALGGPCRDEGRRGVLDLLRGSSVQRRV